MTYGSAFCGEVAINQRDVSAKCIPATISQFALDSAHLEVGSSIDTFHMDEFMERKARSGNSYEPVPNPEPKLDILFAEPGQDPRDRSIPISITYLRNLVDGPLAMVPVGTSAAVLFPNSGDGVFNRSGAFAVVGMNDGVNFLNKSVEREGRYAK